MEERFCHGPGSDPGSPERPGPSEIQLGSGSAQVLITAGEETEGVAAAPRLHASSSAGDGGILETDSFRKPAPTKTRTRKKPGSSKTHQTNKKEVKRPQSRSNSSLSEQTPDIQLKDQPSMSFSSWIRPASEPLQVGSVRTKSSEVEGHGRRSQTQPEQKDPIDCSKASRRSVCSNEFRKKVRRSSSFQEASSVSCVQRESDGFVVSRGDGAVVVTPVVFRCPICKQLQQRWCHYVLHLQSHASGTSPRCDVCGHQDDHGGETRLHCAACCRNSGEEEACRASLSHIWKERKEEEGLSPRGSQAVTSPVSPTFDAPSPASSGLQLPGQSSRFLCGRCGRMFPRWNKLWLHRRLHRQGGGAFRCSRCELEFHFLGSYVHHLQEHVAQTPRACPSCPDAFPDDVNIKQPDLSCRTCGKRFSVRRNLKKHQLLHKGGGSLACLPRSRSFPCHASLTPHLQAHRKRLGVPRPAPVHDPFVFPYRCRKCPGRFSSADLLQAHQVCHFVAGNATGGVSSDPPRLKLPASNRKHLFRYPHPDRLYVVSSPPAVDSDSEDEVKPENSENSLQLKRLIQSLIPEKCLSDASDCESAAAERSDRAACAVCALSFTDATSLHQHYRDHAMKSEKLQEKQTTGNS